MSYLKTNKRSNPIDTINKIEKIDEQAFKLSISFHDGKIIETIGKVIKKKALDKTINCFEFESIEFQEKVAKNEIDIRKINKLIQQQLNIH